MSVLPPIEVERKSDFPTKSILYPLKQEIAIMGSYVSTATVRILPAKGSGTTLAMFQKLYADSHTR